MGIEDKDEAPPLVDAALADELIARAEAEGIELLGPGGLLRLTMPGPDHPRPRPATTNNDPTVTTRHKQRIGMICLMPMSA